MCPMYNISVRSDLILFKTEIDPFKKNKYQKNPEK